MLRRARVRGLVLALAAVASPALLAQQGGAAPPTSAPQQEPRAEPAATPPPAKGTVLFERHLPPVEDTPPNQPDPPAPKQPAPLPYKQPVHRNGLQRRGEDAVKPAQAPAAPAAVNGAEGEAAEKAAEATPLATDRTLRLQPTEVDLKAAEAISNAERAAVRELFTDLDLHLNNATAAVEARARLRVRNGGTEPLMRVPLLISASLHWETARVAMAGAVSAPAVLEQHLLLTDLDHTGGATEASIALPAPLPPGAEVQLDLFYGGTLAASAERLRRLGAPLDQAARTDWDSVSPVFTGLRGPGNVLWYPVAAPPSFLGDGAAFLEAVDRLRQSDAAASMRLRLTLEYSGSKPDAAYFLGERQPLTDVSASGSSAAAVSSSSSPQPSQPSGETDDGTEARSGLAVAAWPALPLNHRLPSLFLANAAPVRADDNSPVEVAGVDAADSGFNNAAAATLARAAAECAPLLADWLGARPAGTLTVVELPVANAAPFADGRLLVMPLAVPSSAAAKPAADAQDTSVDDAAAQPELQVAEVHAASLVYPLTAAWLPAGIAERWLRDGIAEFMRVLWTERTAGREAALTGLAADADLLAQREVFATGAEPESAAAGRSEVPTATAAATDATKMGAAAAPAAAGTLASCSAAPCARTKAAYVFEMLRSVAGQDALKQALAAWRVAGMRDPREATGARLQQLLEHTGGKPLGWFFADWVESDHGLPDLSIVTVAPRRVERGSGTPVVPHRSPVAGPIGPEPVPQPGDPLSSTPAPLARVNSVAPAEGSWLVAVEVQNNGGVVAEVPVTVRAGNLTNVLPLRVPAHGRATVRVPFEAEPQEVMVNDGTVPELRTSTHRRAIAPRQE